jgi:glycosyltransferase involved in cell wall biosynthesis
MTSPRRVLHVIASLSPIHGGTTSAVTQMIAGLEAQGVRCDVACSDDDGPGRRLAPDASERRAAGRNYFAKRTDLYCYTPDMAPWLEAHVRAYDLVHIHGLFSHVNALAGRICRKHGVPYVVTPHGMANAYGMRHKPLRKRVSFLMLEKPLLQGAAAIHMTSRGEQRDLAALNIKTPVTRIPLAVAPVPPGNADALRARHPETAGRPIAVFIGRLNPIKNLEAAIDALAVPPGKAFHLAVCGEGPQDYADALRARALERGVAGRISWLGFVRGQEKSDVLAAGDVYVQPSLSESFGIAAVEAVSAGLPCVLGENVAIAEDLVEAGFAVAVPPTGEGVAAGFEKALALSQTAAIGQRARSFVATEFNSGTIGTALLDLYRQMQRRLPLPACQFTEFPGRSDKRGSAR